jgi:hypothetical protein
MLGGFAEAVVYGYIGRHRLRFAVGVSFLLTHIKQHSNMRCRAHARLCLSIGGPEQRSLLRAFASSERDAMRWYDAPP